MRVNVYAEEMTDRVQIISKEIDGHAFTGLRFYLYMPTTLPKNTDVTPIGDGYMPRDPAFSAAEDGGRVQIKGPFIHRPGDDDSAAVTFWGKQDLRIVLRKALEMLDKHYAAQVPRKDTSEDVKIKEPLFPESSGGTRGAYDYSNHK